MKDVQGHHSCLSDTGGLFFSIWVEKRFNNKIDIWILDVRECKGFYDAFFCFAIAKHFV